MIVPSNKAGLIIGSHGDNLRRIEKQAQVKMQFDQNWTVNPDERKVIIVGLPEDIEEARRLIMDKIMEEPRGARTFDQVQYMVPAGKIGLIIGRGGETIKDIQERSGARIFVSLDAKVDPETGEKPINLTGDAEAIRTAKTLINEILFGVSPSGAGGLGGRPTLTIQIPDTSIGAVMGKRAENLKAIIAATGCRIFIETKNIIGTSMREVQFSGNPESCSYAAHMVQERVRVHQETNGYVPSVSESVSAAAAAAVGSADPYTSWYQAAYASGYPQYSAESQAAYQQQYDASNYAANVQYDSQYAASFRYDPSQLEQQQYDTTQFQQHQQQQYDPSQLQYHPNSPYGHQ
jgi:polyribonucleotide nucleotidyltransferase